MQNYKRVCLFKTILIMGQKCSCAKIENYYYTYFKLLGVTEAWNFQDKQESQDQIFDQLDY